MAAFKKLKGSKGLAYQFIVCDAKPIGLIVAKKITAQHRAQLIQLTGSKRFFPIGTCSFVEGKFHFTMEKPLTGLARKLQESIKNSTGKKLPIVAGAESAEAEEEGQAPAAAAAQASAAKPVSPELAKAAELWNQTRSNIAANVDRLNAAIRKGLAGEAPQVLASVENMIKTFDGAVNRLDGKLADALAKVHAANPAERPAALHNAITMLGNQLHAVQAEKLFAHIDANTFGVATNVEKSLHDCFAQIGRALSHK